jgi:hypothetical protein
VAKLTGQATNQLEPSCKDLVVNLVHPVERVPRMVLNVRSEHRAQQRRQFPRVRASAALTQGPGLFHDLIDGMQKQARRRALGAPDTAAEVFASAAVAPATMTRLRRAHGKASLNSIDDRVVGRWSDQHAARCHFDNQVTEHPDGPTVGGRHKAVEHLPQRAVQAQGQFVRQALVRNGGFAPNV